jgi:hypothetical protein
MKGYNPAVDTVDDLAVGDRVMVNHRMAARRYESGLVTEVLCFQAEVEFFDGERQTLLGSWLKKLSPNGAWADEQV